MPADDKIDLNSITIVQLKEIKGLGKSRAEEIARYRGKDGPFKSVDDLDRVPHVGNMPPDELRRLKSRFIVRLADGEAPPTAPEAEKVDVSLRESPDPASTAADLRAGRIDVMWGGPLRVVLTRAADPTSDIVCFCDVVARL